MLRLLGKLPWISLAIIALDYGLRSLTLSLLAVSIEVWIGAVVWTVVWAALWALAWPVVWVTVWIVPWTVAQVVAKMVAEAVAWNWAVAGIMGIGVWALAWSGMMTGRIELGIQFVLGKWIVILAALVWNGLVAWTLFEAQKQVLDNFNRWQTFGILLGVSWGGLIGGGWVKQGLFAGVVMSFPS